ncbi:MAG TPA: hypothetical protein PLS56_01410 [Candidatus Dojkabacteria bacterium]|nr:hypothetical protein [Candidatus Dojkabacteria bacterium]
MEKQYTKTIAPYLFSLASKETGIPEEICEKVVMWVYNDTKNITQTCNSVELSGFGSLLVSKGKTERGIKKMKEIKAVVERSLREEPTVDTKRRTKILATANAKLEHYTKKTKYELERNSGGVQESPASTGTPEGTDREDIQGEAGDLQELPV